MALYSHHSCSRDKFMVQHNGLNISANYKKKKSYPVLKNSTVVKIN